MVRGGGGEEETVPQSLSYQVFMEDELQEREIS